MPLETDNTSPIGKPVHRREDFRLLTGRGRFVENRDHDGLHAVFVRSPVAHGQITAINTGEALALPGIRAVYTGADLESLGLNPLPCVLPQDSSDGTPFRAPVRPALAVDRVRFVGEAVAMIVADTLTAARDAADLVDLSIDELPAVTDTALSDDVAFDMIVGDRKAVDEGFARAAHHVRIDGLVNNRVVVSPIETRSAIASFDPEAGRYTLITQSQGVHLLKRTISQTLGVEPDRLHVVTEDVGGSFATKLMNYPEQTMALAAARALGRPVRWVSGRDEAFLSDAHGRDHVSSAELALDADGRFLALRIESKGALGAYASTLAPSITGKGFVKVAGHSYAIPAITTRAVGVYTNTAPTDAYRGAGKPEVIYLVERLIEKAAREIGFDRFDLRRKNLIPKAAMPYAHANGFTYDSGDLAASFDAALNAADLAGYDARRAASAARGRLRGIAVCPGLHLTGGTPGEETEILITPDGEVLVKTGVQASGQGHETAFAQIVASRLEIPMEKIVILEGDSDRIRTGGGSGGSSSLPIAGTTIDRASQNLIDTARDQAAEVLEAAPADLTYGAGQFTVIGTDRTIDLFDLSARREADGLPGCAGGAAFEGDLQTVPHSGHMCEVEVDPETGRVEILRYVSADDLGIKLNPPIADGQIHGGLVQALGQALMEHTVYDETTGQLLTGSFMDYAMPRAADLPHLELIDVSVATAANHLGMKGVGELSTNGGLAPVICAIMDAIGTDDLQMPATPERVWRALRKGAPA